VDSLQTTIQYVMKSGKIVQTALTGANTSCDPMTAQGFFLFPHGTTRIYPSSIGSMQGTAS
jgi:hypothetical protein